MYSVSNSFLTSLRGSHEMRVRAKVVSTYQTGTSPLGDELVVLDGDVQLSATSDIRGTLDITIGEVAWPTRRNTTLAPYGNEIFVERGIRLRYTGDESVDVEWVPLGYFRIEDPEQDDPENGPIRISGKDRMAGIIDARLLFPVEYSVGSTLGFIVNELVQEVYPLAVISWDDDTFLEVLTRSILVEEDRFGFLNDLITSFGKIWYFDGTGTLVIKDQPAIEVPVWEVDAGRNGVLLSVSRKLSRQGVYNAVVAAGEATDTEDPVRAAVVDANPNSPTYYYDGRFGPVPRFYSSPMITTTDQAVSAATSILRKQLGLPYSVDFTAIPNPALEPFDPVRIRPSEKSGREIHVIETVKIPLSPDEAISASTREQTKIITSIL